MYQQLYNIPDNRSGLWLLHTDLRRKTVYSDMHHTLQRKLKNKSIFILYAAQIFLFNEKFNYKKKYDYLIECYYDFVLCVKSN